MPKPSLSEIGLSGLRRQGGYVAEEFLPQLQGDRAIQIFREMRDNDPVVGGILFAVDKLIRQVEWRVEPASPKNDDAKVAEFVDSCMTDMSHSWEDFISEVLSMLVFGWSWFEIVYKKRVGPDERDSSKRSQHTDGKIGWRKFSIRAQETLNRWEFDEDDGSVSTMIQLAPPDWRMHRIPITKSLLFRTTSHKNNPEGRSILRNAYRPWVFKKRIEEVEAIGIERDLAGFPMLYIDPILMSPDATSDQQAIYDEYKDVIVNIRRDAQEGLILPSIRDEHGQLLYQLDLVSSSGQRQFDTNGIIQRYDQRIATTVLADFILLGQQTHGSFAMSSDKTDLFAVALRAWMEVIRSTLNKYAVPRLLDANGMKPEKLPKFQYGDIETPPLGELGNFIQVLSNAGVPLFPDEQLENYLRQIASLPERGPDAPDPKQVFEQQQQQAAAMANQVPKPPGVPDFKQPPKPVAKPGQAMPKAQPKANGQGQ